MAMTDDEAIKTLSAELRYMLDDRNISQTIQAGLARSGFRTMGLLSAIADTRAEIREMAKTEFGLDTTAANLTNEVKMSRRQACAALIDVWESCKRRNEELDKQASEAKASKLPMTFPKSDISTLRTRYEAEYGKKEDSHFPADSFIEKRFQEMEDGEIKADSLDIVVSREECAEDSFTPALDKEGRIKVRNVNKKVPLPRNSEEYRSRMKLMAVTFVLAAYKHPNRAWLKTAKPSAIQDHVDFILGEDISGFTYESEGGRSVPVPWTLVLSYDFQVRKLACRYINHDDEDFEASLRKARENGACKEKHFSTPLAIQMPVLMNPRGKGASSSAGEGSSGWREPPSPKGRGKGTRPPAGRGNSKGKSKGRGKAGKPNSITPDGRRICFGFNHEEGCDNRQCAFVHCCQFCFGNHPKTRCRKRKHDKAAGGNSAAAGSTEGSQQPMN